MQKSGIGRRKVQKQMEKTEKMCVASLFHTVKRIFHDVK